MKLNNHQQEAVFHTNGPLIICAGAGSGKTGVIAHRTFHLIKTLNIHPENITCVTFTNKAAKEMKHRITSMLENSISSPIITTFHGYALRIIRMYGKAINIQDYTVIGDDEQQLLMKRIIKNFNIQDKECSAKKVLSAISFAKNNTLPGETLPIDTEHIFYQLYQAYEKEKKISLVMDFDDVLLYALRILYIPEILAEIQKKTKHLLIDEYQDTNIIQHLLVKRICLQQDKTMAISSLCVVGDEDQSIYSWRGANVNNIINFTKEFPDAKVISLEQNYRSSRSILETANQVITINKNRREKKLWTDKHDNLPVYIVEYNNGIQEAESIAKILKHMQKKNELGKAAILYRSHHQSRLIEEACITYNIKYSIFGGINFYARQEIKDILSYLQTAINEYDRTSFLRCINTPARNFGDAAQADFLSFWNNSDNLSIRDAINQYIEDKKGTERNRKTLKEFFEIIETLLSLKENPQKAINFVINKIDYDAHIVKNAENKEEIETRRENLQELENAAHSFMQEYSSHNLFDFLDHLSLLHENNNNDTEEAVTLLTVHSAKGLEFDTVFIIGAEEGIFPSIRSASDSDGTEEERRLFYVAITRAKKKLIITSAASRLLWGTVKQQMTTRFLDPVNNPFTCRLKTSMLSRESIDTLIINNETIVTEKKTTEKNSHVHLHQENNLYIGKKITHKIFGEGHICYIEGNTLTIDFISIGRKKIASNFII